MFAHSNILKTLESFFTPWHGLLYFGFGQIYTQQTALGGLLVAWSLCVEVTLYAFLPLWAFTMRLRRPVDTRGRFRMELLGILALLAFSIVFKATYVNANQAGGAGIRLAQALPRYMDAFAIGMLLALLSAWYEDRRLPRPLRVVDRFPVVPWLLAAGVFWVLCTQVGLPRNPFNFVKLDLPQIVARDVLRTLFAALLLVPCVFGDQTRGVLRRILRSSLRTAGDPVQRHWRAPTRRPRPVVLVCDVSGSMTAYARMLLQYVHASVAARRRVEAFAFGTRLTRITNELSGRDHDLALERASAAVPISLAAPGSAPRSPSSTGCTGAASAAARWSWSCPTDGTGAIPRCSTSRWHGCGEAPTAWYG